MKKLFIFLTILFVVSFQGKAQFIGGIPTGKHAGVIGTTVNPAFTNHLSGGTDLLVFSFSMNILNNGFYLDPKPITSYVNPNIVSSITGKSTNGESINEKFDRIYNIRRDLKTSNYIFADAAIYGPSFLMSFNNHSFGLTTAFKAGSNTVRLPKEMALFLLKGANSDDLIGKETNLNRVSSNTMVYTDIAFNYSVKLKENLKYSHRFGVNLHYLNGINSIIFQDNNSSKWSFIGDSSIYFRSSDFDFNYAATKTSDLGELMAGRGNGFAFDIGYTLTKKKKGRPTRTTVCPNIRNLGRVREFQEYKWRFGISLMDIGFIRFNEQTSTNSFINAEGIAKNLDQSFYKGVFALERALIFDFAGNPATRHIQNTTLTQYTAARLNLTLDIALKNNWFVNLANTQRIPMPVDYYMKATNIFSATIRREKDKGGIYIPINLIEYQTPSVGFAFKSGPFFMGTNHIFELIGLRNIKGLDLFFGLKFNLSNFRGA